mgnify:CR=1 FL=1
MIALGTAAAADLVGQGQQPLALDAALGEERQAAIVIKTVFTIGGGQVFHIAGEGVIAQGAFGQADQDPVAVLRLEPGAQLLLPLQQRQREQ